MILIFAARVFAAYVFAAHVVLIFAVPVFAAHVAVLIFAAQVFAAHVVLNKKKGKELFSAHVFAEFVDIVCFYVLKKILKFFICYKLIFFSIFRLF